MGNEELRQLILNTGLKWDEGLTGQGDPSRWLFDLREVVLTPRGMRLSLDALSELLQDSSFDCIAGPTVAGEPLVAGLISRLRHEGKNVSGAIVRSKPNEYGLRKKVEGPIKMGLRTVVVDDLVNSGRSVLETIRVLRTEGLEVVRVITLMDLGNGADALLENEGARLSSVFSMEDVPLGAPATLSYEPVSTQNVSSPPSEDAEALVENEGEVAFFFKDGQIWSHTVGNLSCEPAYSDDFVFFAVSGLRQSRVYLTAKKDGVIRWSRRMKGKVGSLSISAGYCLAGISDALIRFSDEGEEIWRLDTPGKVERISSSAGYAVTDEGTVILFDDNGRMRWKKHVGKMTCSPTINGDSMFLGTENGLVFCLGSQEGSLRWAIQLKNTPRCLLCNARGLFVGCDDGFLYRITEGNVSSAYKIGDFSISELHKEKDRVLIMTEDGSWMRMA